MTELWPMQKFTAKIEQDPAINGDKSVYTFALQTEKPLADGDVLEFKFPPEVTLPQKGDLKVKPLPRIKDNVEKTDDVLIDLKDDKVLLTFLSVAPADGTYSWQIENIKNPPSTKPTEPFSGIKVSSQAGDGIQSYKKTGPRL